MKCCWYHSYSLWFSRESLWEKAKWWRMKQENIRLAEGHVTEAGIMDVELIECFVFHIPPPPPVSSTSVNIITIHPTPWARDLEIILVFLFFLQFKAFPKCISNASVCLHFPNSKCLSSLTRTTVALIGLTCDLAALSSVPHLATKGNLVLPLSHLRSFIVSTLLLTWNLKVPYAVPHDLTPTCLSTLTSWPFSSLLPPIITF